MKKLTIIAAGAGILLSAMSYQASAQNGRGFILGEPGARNGHMCWKAYSNDLAYFGYWVRCPGSPAPAPVRAPEEED